MDFQQREQRPIDHQRLTHSDVTEAIIGAFYEVYNTLGFGFLESVYGNALALAFDERKIRFERERLLIVHYRDMIVGQFRADYLVEDRVVVEIKSLDRISASNEKQLLNYLSASKLSVGLVLNFGPRAGIRRVFRSAGRVQFSGSETATA